MATSKFRANKKEALKTASFALNIVLTFSVILLALYLITPLWGGKMAVGAIIHSASWIGMALLIKFYLNRKNKGLHFKVYDYLMICLYTIICVFIWFRYPVNIILSIVGITGFAFSYKHRHAG